MSIVYGNPVRPRGPVAKGPRRRGMAVARAAGAVVRGMLEALEPRRLLAVALADGVLTIDGTTGNDTLEVFRHGKDLDVELNGAADGSFERKDVDAIRIFGGTGDDLIRLNGDVIGSSLFGNEGNDTLIGGENDDALDGGDGNDTTDGKAGADLLIGGAGFDSADYRFESNDMVLSIDGVANEQGGGAQGDNISLSIERIVSGGGNDLITGSDADNSVTGRDGNDTILGGLGNDSLDGDAGNDSLAGESGNDVLTGGDGGDTMTGGAGDDSFVANDGNGDTLDGGSGSDNAVADQPGDSITSVESGVNIPAPEVTVTAGATGVTDNFSTIDFGTVTQGQGGPTRTFTVRNDGDDVLSVGAVSVPAGFALVDPLAGPIAPGSSESFTVQVDTSVAGSLGGTVSFANSDADENPFNFTVTATVDPAPPQLPEIAVSVGGNGIADGSTAAIGFGTVDRGAAGPTRTFAVRNDGNGTLTLGAIALPAGFTLVDGLPSSLAPGASESFTVRMDTGAAGAKAGRISVPNNDTDEDPFDFAVAGTVNEPPPPPAPEVTVTQARPANTLDDGNSTVEFGNTVVGSGRGPTRTFRVRNDGQAVLTFGAVSVPAGFKLIDPLVGPLAPGEAESFVVQVDTSAPGAKNGFVSFATNDPNENPFSFRAIANVGVEATPRPEVTVNALQRRTLRGVVSGVSSFSFGTGAPGTKVSRRPARTFRVANDGNADLSLGAVSVSAGFVLVDGLPSVLRPGETDAIVVALDTSAAAGGKSGTVSFSTNDRDEDPYRFMVTGTVGTPPGTPPAAPEVEVRMTDGTAVADGAGTPISLGSVQRDARAPSRTFRVRNTGTAALNVGSVSVPSGFAVMDPLVGPIAPGQAESFTIALRTDGTGARSGRVTFATNDANENPFDFAVSGSVSAPPPAAPRVTAALSSGGTLTINGTAGIDTVSFALSSAGLSVVGNGRTVAGSPFNGVRRITVNALDGDDRVDLSGLSIPATLAGGNGNDTLIGSAADDSIAGGAGNDALTGNAGLDVLLGEGGNDTLNGIDGAADRLLDGGAGTDTVRKDRTDSATGT